MASKRLSNYLRTFRKRSALSQADVAYLLGVPSSAKVCRYERFARLPGLETALACQAIFGRPVSDLFPGLFKEIEAKVCARARKMIAKKNGEKAGPSAARKRETITAIVNGY